MFSPIVTTYKAMVDAFVLFIAKLSAKVWASVGPRFPGPFAFLMVMTGVKGKGCPAQKCYQYIQILEHTRNPN